MKTFTQSFAFLVSIICFFPSYTLAQNPTTEIIIDISNHPVCGFDLLNHLEDHEHPSKKAEWETYLKEVLPVLSTMSSPSSNLISIPVVVHVIHNGEPVGSGQNISAAQVQAQIDILNEDFTALNPNFGDTPEQWQDAIGNPNIQFCLANTDPNGNATDGIDRQIYTITGADWQNNNINSNVKPDLNWDPDNYFNIYVLPIPGTTANGGVVGFANRPFTSLVGASTDGVVVDYRWFGGPDFSVSGYKTLTHETGHYLGLPHPFNGTSCNADDGIDDTPNMEDATRNLATFDCLDGFPTGPISCGNEHMYVNYMDYVVESCYTSFTSGQINVMRAVLEGNDVPGFNYGSREQLANNSNFVCSLAENDAGVIDIIEPDFRVCTTEDITPVVTIRNFGINDLTEVDISYQINDDSPITLNWTGNLESGGNLDVTLNTYTPEEGFFEFRAFTSMPNGVEDERMPNDTTAFLIEIAIPSGDPLTEDFEEALMGYPTPNGLFTINPDADDFFWLIGNGVSAYGEGEVCGFFNNFDGSQGNNPFGTIDALVTPHFDFTSIPNPEMTFDVAYAQFDDTFSDSLIILAAVDCSPTFNQVVFFKGGDDLATADDHSEMFVPTADEWRTETVDLSAFVGETDVSFAFVNISGWGNLLFLDNINVGVTCALSVESSMEEAGCFGECTGTATVNVLDGNNVTYQWDDNAGNQTTATAINLCAGTYSVTVTDAVGCFATTQVTVDEPSELSLSIDSNDETAYDANDGSASAMVGGGAGNYTYSWSSGQTTTSVSGLAPGDYTVQITDNNNCTVSQSFTINEFDCGAFAVSVQGTDVTCFGNGDGSADASISAGNAPYSYSWSNGQSGSTANNLQPGTYFVTATDGFNCPSVAEVVIGEPSQLSVNTNSTAETTNGGNDGTATAAAEGGTAGYSYNWSNGGNSASIENLAPGEYTVTVTDNNNCTATAIVTVGSFDCGGFSASMDSENISCFGANDGSAQISFNGGQGPFSYSWSHGINDPEAVSLSPGNYQVSITDANDCELVLSTTITEPSQLESNLTVVDESGNGENDGSATSATSGGTPPYNYNWSNGQTGSSVSNLSPGFYSLTVSDANDCEVIENFSINEFDCALFASISSVDASCPNNADGSATVVNIMGGDGPFSYQWSNGSEEATATNLSPDTYFVTITDANGCDIVEETDIEGIDSEFPNIVVQQNITIELDASGNASLSVDMVDNGSSDNCGISEMSITQESFNCDDIGDNTVFFYLEDIDGNSDEEAVTITVVDNLAPTLLSCPTDISINDCDAVVNYSLPTFEDNCDAEAVLISGFESGSNFPVGTTMVSYDIVDPAGNSVNCNFNVTVNYDLNLEYSINQPSCPGFSDGAIVLSVSGGLPPFFVQFETGGDPVELSAGTYSVTVIDNNGCQIIEEIEVTDPEPLSYEFGDTSPATNSGANGSAELNVFGGTPPYSFQWQLDNQVISSDQNPNNLLPGTYTVVVIDDKGCTLFTDEITIDNVVGVDEFSFVENINLFPNPNSGKFYVHIQLREQQELELGIFDVTGKQISPIQKSSTPSLNSTFQLNISNHPNGVYWLKIIVGQEVLTKKVVLLQN